MTRVVINQSNYIPWKGYFDLIHDADIFIFYDDAQYTKNDWRNRNKLKCNESTLWLTIPVGIDLNRRICDVSINNYKWQSKHLKTIIQLYSKAPYFNYLKDFLEEVYIENKWHNLSVLNQFIIKKIARDFLGIKACFLNSADLQCEGKGQDKVLNLLKSVSATTYLSGPAAKNYLLPSSFEQENIELIWKDYSGYPEYHQFYPPFEHAVSIIDLIMNTGKEAPHYIWGWRSRLT
ncbi:MAG: WbqC family protein [Smithella sp.]